MRVQPCSRRHMADPASDIAFWHPGWPMADWASGSIAAVILNSCQPFRLQARAAALAGSAALYHIETGSRDNGCRKTLFAVRRARALPTRIPHGISARRGENRKTLLPCHAGRRAGSAGSVRCGRHCLSLSDAIPSCHSVWSMRQERCCHKRTNSYGRFCVARPSLPHGVGHLTGCAASFALSGAQAMPI